MTRSLLVAGAAGALLPEPARPRERSPAQALRARVGNVKITAVCDPEAEEVQLAQVRHLSPTELQEVNKTGLQMDERAYRTAHDTSTP